jgi:hypothetical protein
MEARKANETDQDGYYLITSEDKDQRPPQRDCAQRYTSLRYCTTVVISRWRTGNIQVHQR